MPDFQSLSLSLSLALFGGAALAVWVAGTRIAACAAEISRRSGLGEALMGLLLLAGVTSLPEVATSFTAALDDNAELAVNNLLGSIAMQLAVLAIADSFIGQRALTSVVPDPVVILQGALNIVLLGVVALATLVGDVPVFGAGAWTWGLLLAAGYSFWKLAHSRGRRPWAVSGEFTPARQPRKEADAMSGSNRRLGLTTAALAAVILLAGYLVAETGAVIADKSGLGDAFVGVAFVAAATSLPEASTVIASMRRGLYTMAISDILGTNILNVALLGGVDLIVAGPPVLTRVGVFATVGTLLGVVVTGLFLMGLAERRDRTVMRLGIDSAAVLVVYLGGMVLLYSLRGTG